MYYADNLIFNTDKSCWALFKLEGFQYEKLSNASKVQMNIRLSNYLVGFTTDVQIFVIPIIQDIEEHYKKIKKKLDKEDVLHEKIIKMADKTRDYLLENVKEESSEYESYICVKLEKTQGLEVLKDKVGYFIKEPINAINTWLSLDTRDILISKIERYSKLAEEWFRNQNERLSMRVTTTKETQWLLKRMGFRGLKKEVELWYSDIHGMKDWKPKYEIGNVKNDEKNKTVRPWKKDIINLFDGEITPKGRYLEVNTEAGISYQSFLVLTQLPDEMTNPSTEWLYWNQKHNLKAEICIHIQSLNNRASLAKINSQAEVIEGQIEHIQSARMKVPSEIREGQDYSTAIESEIRNGRTPLLYTTIQFCIASDNLEEMNQRVEKIRAFYQDEKFVLERPISDQLKLYFNFIPTVANVSKDYIIPLTTLGLASSMIGVISKLGDNVGPYIGDTENFKKVFLALWKACLDNKSAACSFLGDLGFGKSFNANLVAILSVLYSGGDLLILCPKGERAKWKKKFKLFKGLINMVEISADNKNIGRLDPFNIYKNDFESASTLAMNNIIDLCKLTYGSPMYIVLKEAIPKLKDWHEIPSMNAIINILESWEEKDEYVKEAKGLARLIKAEKNVGMAKLLFGNGKEESIELNNRINIILVQNLKLPDREISKEDYTSEEIVSSVIMGTISQFSKKFALLNQDRAIKKFRVMLIDESWFLGATAQGREMYSFLLRMGRSLFFAPIFNGHSVLDIADEKIRTGITYRFCFHTSDIAEAERMLEYLGLENTQSNIRRIMSLPNRVCLFKDADNNVAELQFNAVFSEFISVFSTTPVDSETHEE